jgi:galactokinase
MQASLLNLFYEKFGGTVKPRFFRSPARINIIGEHVDYVGGLVLPAAIQFSTNLLLRPNSTKNYRIYSPFFDSYLETDKVSYQSEKKWANYILGVLSELQKEGFAIPGFDLLVDGNIPQGAGLSSSASLEVGVGFALSECFSFSIPREKIAVIGQKAENNFVGTKCGIMDQFIISVGKKNQCILLNTETLQYSYTNIDSKEYEFYLVNSNVKHSLETSAYNTRREECESAFLKLKSQYPGYKNLYSIFENQINFLDFPFTEAEYKRVQHISGEKKRTENIIQAFSSGNMKVAGSILTETHDSLSKLFEVSCPETDFLVSSLVREGVSGARMIGGGFGGCILVLDAYGNKEKLESKVKKNYFDTFGIEAEFYSFQISDGVSELQYD